MKFIICATILSITTAVAKDRVIYGQDNRRDVYEVRNQLHLRLAKSTAGMVSQKKFSYNPTEDTYSIRANYKLGRAFNLCSSEKFAEQKLLANCSGFLVNEDTLVTAGHCMVARDSYSDPCKDNKWVFELKMESSNHINTDSIPSQNVYECKKIVKVKLDREQDFAVIKLDRKVVGRNPLNYRESGRISRRAGLVVIGHPSMLPTKIAAGGRILENSNRYKIITNLDTFQGNSGSAVFDQRTGMLEGILVSGKTDYQLSRPLDKRSCKVVNRCSETGANCEFRPKRKDGSGDPRGEAVTRITTLTRYFN